MRGAGKGRCEGQGREAGRPAVFVFFFEALFGAHFRRMWVKRDPKGAPKGLLVGTNKTLCLRFFVIVGVFKFCVSSFSIIIS